jgi:hypothetical protein
MQQVQDPGKIKNPLPHDAKKGFCAGKTGQLITE